MQKERATEIADKADNPGRVDADVDADSEADKADKVSVVDKPQRMQTKRMRYKHKGSYRQKW